MGAKYQCAAEIVHVVLFHVEWKEVERRDINMLLLVSS